MANHPVARNHKELLAWQLCAELRKLVLAYTRTGPAATDFRFRDQIRAAARSACYVTSEGFYRKRDGDFLNFLVFAVGSIGEVADQVNEGLDSEYFTAEQHAAMMTFVKRAFGANRGLRRYLEASQREKKGSERPPHRRSQRPNGS